MISAWDVYWVLQLDSLNSAAAFMAWMGFLAALAAALVRAITFKEVGAEPEPDKYSSYATSALHEAWADRRSSRALSDAAVKWIKRFSAVFALSFVAATILPSTKTAAAMVVLPAIANNETLQREAGELYGIAKQALKDAVGVKPDEAKD